MALSRAWLLSLAGWGGGTSMAPRWAWCHSDPAKHLLLLKPPEACRPWGPAALLPLYSPAGGRSMVLLMVATFLFPKEVASLGICSASTHINSVSRSDHRENSAGIRDGCGLIPPHPSGEYLADSLKPCALAAAPQTLSVCISVALKPPTIQACHRAAPSS